MSLYRPSLRWAAIAAGVAALAAAGALAAAALWLDAGAIGSAVAARITARLGWPVEFESADTTAFPFPAVRLDGMRLRTGVGDEVFLTARRVTVRVAWLPLLTGRVALRSVDVEAPHLRLRLGPDGAPALPASSPRPRSADTQDDPLRVWITSVAIREGSAELGPQRVAAIRAEGSAHLDGSADLAFEGEWVGVGAIREGRLEAADLAGSALAWTARWELRDVDLETLSDALPVPPTTRVEGRARALVQLAGRGDRLARGSVRAALQSLRWEHRELSVTGEAALAADLDGSWTLDLAGARIEAGSAVRKPVGLPARLGGRLAAKANGIDTERAHDLWLEIGRSALRGSARWSGPPAASLSGVVDWSEARQWLSLPSLPAEGQLAVDELIYAPPRAAAGRGRLEGVVLALGEERVALSGPVSLEDATLRSDGLIATFLGETFRVEGSVDLAHSQLDVLVEAREGVELARLWEALGDADRISGRAYGSLRLRGPLDGDGLSGHGEFEVQNGEMVHVSLERLATARVRPAARERYPFRRLRGRFALADGTLVFSQLDLDQDDAAAELRGSFSLADQTVDLVGEARFFVGPDFVPIPFRLTGPLRSFQARFDVETPAEEAESRRGRRQLLEGMLELLVAQPAPEDPEAARRLREQIQHVQAALRALREDERSTRPGSGVS